MGLVKPHHVAPSGKNERKRTRDLAGLVAELEDPNATARRWAARDLRDWPGASAALLDRLMREPDHSVREVILTTLTLSALGDAVAVAALVSLLRSEDANLRNEAIEAMKHLPVEVAAVMGGLLEDPYPDVRIFAVNILESLRHPDVESWLLAVIARDPHLNVCATAVDLLGEVGSVRAVEPLRLLKARFGGEPYIQFAADLALSRIEG